MQKDGDTEDPEQQEPEIPQLPPDHWVEVRRGPTPEHRGGADENGGGTRG
jgi:hypothetical protein